MIEKTKHTPGPWLAKRLASYTEPGHVLLWPDKGATHMRRLDFNGNFTEPDARLMAAAPELLAAAMELIQRLDTPAWGDVSDLRAAVAKALGNNA